MEETVIQFMEKNELINQNSTVCIGVSGGPDSMALLHFYMSLREKWGLKLIVLSADHQLRGAESDEDLQYVEDMCRTWGVPFIGTKLDVNDYKETAGVGTQVAARTLRYRFFYEQMMLAKADYLALGHHGDDQVETMLMNFTRSSNVAALGGIPVKRKFATGHIVRPFLCLTKSIIENYCRLHHIYPRMDPSNMDTLYMRNYFRKYIIPLIKTKNNNIHTIAQHLSTSLFEDERYLQQEAEAMVAKVVDFDKNPLKVIFEINTFKSYALSLQRRGFHLILNYLYNKMPENLSYVHEDIFFRLLETQTAYKQLDYPKQLQIEKSYERIIFSFQEDEERITDFNELLTVPGHVILPDGSRLTATYIDTNANIYTNDDTFVCCAENVMLPLHIRTRKPGDRMTWKGLKGTKKIKDIFIDEKVHREKRDNWPIVTDHNGEILWLVGIKKAIPKKTSTICIKLEFEKGKK